MKSESQMTQLPPRPILPVWATIPLYIVTSFLFIGIFGELLLIPFSVFPESESTYYVMSKEFVFSLSSMLGVWVCAVLFLKYLEYCPVSELGMSIKGRWKDCLAGVLFAVVVYSIGFVVSLGVGTIEIIGTTFDFGVLIGTFFVFFTAAAMEEIMIRGYIQGRLMTKINKFAAMAIASLIFSAMHIPNPNIGLFPLFNLFLAGLLLGSSYVYTRNLWFPITLHTAWNWIQGPILGYEVSGTKMFPSVFQLHLPEENIINGGHFGFEGSIVCTVLMIIGMMMIIGYGLCRTRKP